MGNRENDYENGEFPSRGWLLFLFFTPISLPFCFAFLPHFPTLFRHFFFCHKVLVAPLAHFLWATPPSPPLEGRDIYAKHTLTHIHPLQSHGVAPFLCFCWPHKDVSLSGFSPGSFAFSYCWLRHAKCALMHFTTLYDTVLRGSAREVLPGHRANVNYGKLMRKYICDLSAPNPESWLLSKVSFVFRFEKVSDSVRFPAKIGFQGAY